MSINIPKRFQDKLSPAVSNLIFNNELNGGNGIETYIDWLKEKKNK